MSHITYSPTTIGGKLAAGIAADALSLSATAKKTKELMDSITNGGANPENLETDPTFALPSGAGAAFYAALVAIAVTAATIDPSAISVYLGG